MSSSSRSTTATSTSSISMSKLQRVKDVVNSIKELQQDHESRIILFSRLPSTREQNPERYNNMITFWTNAIKRVITESNLLIFTPAQLKDIFTFDGGVSPISILPIIDEIEKNGDLQSMSTYTTELGWTAWLWHRVALPSLKWSLSKVMTTGSGTSPRKNDTSNKAMLERRLVYADLVNEMAEQLYQQQLDRIVSPIDNIVSITSIEKQVADWMLSMAIESAHSNQQIMESLCDGVATLKKVNERMSVDQVDKIMDDFSEVMLDQKEIDDAVKSGFAATSASLQDPDEEEKLEQELQELEKEWNKEQSSTASPAAATTQTTTSPVQSTPSPTTTTTTTTITTTATIKSAAELTEEEQLLAELDNLSVSSTAITEEKEEKKPVIMSS
ncbi:hypothetical protein SAMD00019534_115270, partial [Acytostelium subglobosum LB1]|uniref:hypothetical protein n=1 Tax=Acytostelium subglobosum LB1 TaxID=1410327 RepID=UPI00064493CE